MTTEIIQTVITDQYGNKKTIDLKVLGHVIITITKEIVGETPQRVLGWQPKNTPTQSTQVSLYKAIAIDSVDKKFKIEFSVTRDAYTVLKGDDTDSVLKLTNVPFEPKDGHKNKFIAQIMPNGYPPKNGTLALKLTQQGSEVMHATTSVASVEMGYRTKDDVASGVMMHVGGLYKHIDGFTHLAASEGCFGITEGSSLPSNNYSNEILSKIMDQAKKDKSKIEVIIIKREDNEIIWTKTQQIVK